MVNSLDSRLSTQLHYLILLIASCILVALSLIFLHYPANAAEGVATGNQPHTQADLACTPPDDWGQTTRLKVPDKPTKQWSFNVDQPEMMVSLVFFYYQDYDKAGCPFDCSAGDCQTDETGHGETPFGSFSVLDGKEGANRGSKQFGGRLAQGTYQVTFTANGDPGSINVGLHVRQEAVPTATPTQVPTEVTPSSTPEPTEITPEPEDTATPTPTSRPKRTPPATLPPPTPFPGSPPPQALIPQTGFELGEASSMLLLIVISFGIGLLGLGITFYSIAKRLRRDDHI